MNFFRKKKKPEDVQKSQNEHLLDELCNVLKTHGIMFFFFISFTVCKDVPDDVKKKLNL